MNEKKTRRESSRVFIVCRFFAGKALSGEFDLLVSKIISRFEL
jgi:hypothetical protein